MQAVSVTTAGEFARFVLQLAKHQRASTLTLEAYLCALWGLLQKAQHDKVSWRRLAQLLEDALWAPPVAYDAAWMAYHRPPDLDAPDAASFGTLQSMLLYQIADLERMRAAGMLDQPAFILWSGIVSPTGETWYNFSPSTYLECAAAAMNSGSESTVCDWLNLTFFLWCGQTYE